MSLFSKVWPITINFGSVTLNTNSNVWPIPRVGDKISGFIGNNRGVDGTVTAVRYMFNTDKSYNDEIIVEVR